MKFYLDEDLAPAIAVSLRRRGVDAVSAHEVGQVGLSDAEELAFASGQGRCLISANAPDFNQLGRDAVEQGRPHAGIVLCPPRIHGLYVGILAKVLVEVAKRYPAGLDEYDVVYL